MRIGVSGTTLLALLTIALAILLPIGTVVQTQSLPCGTCGAPLYFTHTTDLSLSRMDVLIFLYPGIVSVFTLWILVASIHALNLLLSSRGVLSPIVSWLVFLPALVAQIYLPSLVLNLALPISNIVSLVSQPNILCLLPVAFGLILISLRNRQKSPSNQWTRIGYG